MPSLVEIGPVAIWRRFFFNSVTVVSLFCCYLPLEKDVAFYLNKLEYHSSNDALFQVWLKLAQWFWIKICRNFVIDFPLFHYHYPIEKGGALHLNKLEFLSLNNALCQVWLKLAEWFWRRRFLKFSSKYFHYF